MTWTGGPSKNRLSRVKPLATRSRSFIRCDVRSITSLTASIWSTIKTTGADAASRFSSSSRLPFRPRAFDRSAIDAMPEGSMSALTANTVMPCACSRSVSSERRADFPAPASPTSKVRPRGSVRMRLASRSSSARSIKRPPIVRCHSKRSCDAAFESDLAVSTSTELGWARRL